MPDERGRLEFGDRCAPSCDADSRMGWMKNFLRKFPVHAGSRSAWAGALPIKQKSQSNAGKKTDFLAWRSLRKRCFENVSNRKSPPGGLRVYRRSGYGDSLSPERKFTSVPRTTAWSGCWCRIFRPFPGNSPVSSDLPWWKISVNYQRI